jgi:phosphate transport system substrate-binding protein
MTKTFRHCVLVTAVLLGACGKGADNTQTQPAAPASTPAAPAPAVAAPATADLGLVRIDGSSTVYPIIEAVAEEFQIGNGSKIKVTVGVSGTGGGFKKFCRGELDMANASRPIQKTEMDECAKMGVKFFELPIAYDALTVVVNPGNTALSDISVEDLRKMWEPAAQGTVMSWVQVNPNWPDQPLKLYGAGSDSGTFDYFTEAVVGKAKSSRGDYTASEDDNVLVQGIMQDANALGYFGYAYYAENKDKLKALGISAAGGAPVLPSKETVIDGTYRPLSRPLFVYVSESAYQRAEVQQFVAFALDHAAELTEEVKYVPLPSDAYETVRKHLSEGKLGTVFGGEAATGVTIEELLKREAAL